jgi:hAT family C-terminal dimerisation region
LQENQGKWPTLFKLAMDLLAIQGTSVPCEHVFSASKETARARRNRLGPKIMEALQVLKFHSKQDINFTQGLKEVDQVAELEEEEAAVPVEDMIGYLRDVIE